MEPITEMKLNLFQEDENNSIDSTSTNSSMPSLVSTASSKERFDLLGELFKLLSSAQDELISASASAIVGKRSFFIFKDNFT